MEYYKVDTIMDRRIRPEDGALEYRTRWQGDDAISETWEPRENISEYCAGAVQRVDQEQMDVSDARIAAWRKEKKYVRQTLAHVESGDINKGRKRSRLDVDDAALDPEIEVLYGLLLRDPKANKQKLDNVQSDTSSSNSNSYCGNSALDTLATREELQPQLQETDSVERADVIMLGELILSDEAASVLNNNNSSKRRRGATALLEDSHLGEKCAPAMRVENMWRERYGVSFMHGCVASGAYSSVLGDFAVSVDTAALAPELSRAPPGLEIIGLAPPQSIESGLPFVDPVSPVPWTGSTEAERLRKESVADHPELGATALELLRPQREQMVVRYRFLERVVAGAGAASGTTRVKSGVENANEEVKTEVEKDEAEFREVIASMPLSVFRFAFPQLLIDYLLENAIILEDS